jgi:hypothetical protein
MPYSVRDGTGRFSRRPAALREDHFRVDDLRFDQIVSMAREYASLVVYHDLDDKATGPWDDLFSGSEVAAIATILATPVDRMEKAYLAGRPEAPFESNDALLDLFGQWIRDLRKSQGQSGQELCNLISNLAFGAKESYLASLQAIRITQATARRLLPDVQVNGQQDPASSILFAFAVLYGKLQDRLGRFAARRTDFYYQEVLREQPRLGTPDKVDLVLPVVVDKEIEVPAGTEFIASVGGEEFVYATEEPVMLNGASVQDVLTLHLAGDPSEDTGSARTIYGAWCDRLGDSLPRPLFGAPKDGERSLGSWSARIGFILADGILLMREGLGRVIVTFEYAPQSVGGSTLETGTGERSPTRDDIDAFYKDFRNCFRIAYTGPAGWTEVAEYLPSCSMTNPDVPTSCLRVEIAIASETRPIAPYSPKIHGDDYGTALPLLRFELNDQDAPHPYGNLSRFVLMRVAIDVKVHDCRNLTLHNQIGQLSSHSPFAPFGPLPAIGSHLLVGLAETRSKTLTSCRLHLRWDGLPDSTEGFQEWYRDYLHPPSNDDFSVSLAVLADGRWMERPGGDAASSVSLFRTEMDNGTVVGISPESEIDLSEIIPGFKPMDTTEFDRPLEFGPAAKGAFFRLALDAPIGAFGHAEYPQLLTRIMMRNARVKLEKLAAPMPNSPYTPVISSISMDYDASSVVEIENQFESGNSAFRNRMIHLHPFGWESPSRRGRSRVGQVPDLGCRGNLYIGLGSDSPLRRITLYFHLRHDSISIPEESPRWWYLDVDIWRPLPQGSIKHDTTCGLSNSGILTFDLPDSSGDVQTLMPPARRWLRVGVDGSPEKYCQILAIRAQALQATRRAGQSAGSDTGTLPPGSVVGSRKNIPGVEQVMQPAPSHGGRPSEDSETFRIRMSERLHHKGRGVDPLDFEQLVLERFPEVFKAKCFANLMQRLPVRPAPGQILVVPVPYPPSSAKASLEATLNGSLLAKIQEFLQGLCSESARVTVANPSYERMQVHCTVRLRRSGSPGCSLDTLAQAISDWISPWNSIGNNVHFGWKIRQQELHAFLEGLDFVDRVDHFSILRLASGANHRYRLDDTGAAALAPAKQDEIAPSVPWAVAVPMERHLLSESSALDSVGITDPTGLGELAIGYTFVIPTGSP